MGKSKDTSKELLEEKAKQDLNSSAGLTSARGTERIEDVEKSDEDFSELNDEYEYSYDYDSPKKHVKIKPEYAKDNVVLSVNHLKVFFEMGKFPNKFYLKAVHDTNFQIHKGEVFGLVGESGCGKSTTGRSIIKLNPITSGSIYYKGVRISAGDRWNKKEIKWSKKKGEAEIKRIREAQSIEEVETIPAGRGYLYKNKEVNKLVPYEHKHGYPVSASEYVCAQMFENVPYEIAVKKLEHLANQLIDGNYDKNKYFFINEAESKANGEHIKRRLVTMTKKDILALMLPTKNLQELKNSRIETVRYNMKVIEKEQKAKIKQIHYDNKHTPRKLMHEIQMIFQDPIDSLDPRMTVEDIIQEGLKISGSHNKAKNHVKVEEALREVGLIPEFCSRYPHEFSGGQRQRIGIARALVMNPELLICDEPISALDVSIRAQIINLLNDLRDSRNLTILFIAHDLSVVKYFCDTIAVMYFGDMVELAPADELFRHPLHPYTQSLLSAIPSPDPFSEKRRVRIKYDPKVSHDYSKEKPIFQEVIPGHWVLANSDELITYERKIKEFDQKAEEEERKQQEIKKKYNDEEFVVEEASIEEPVVSNAEEEVTSDPDIIIEEKPIKEEGAEEEVVKEVVTIEDDEQDVELTEKVREAEEKNEENIVHLAHKEEKKADDTDDFGITSQTNFNKLFKK